MAAAVPPLIEAAFVALMRALGVGVAAGAAAEAAKEAARRKQEAADKTAATPIARADACVKTEGSASTQKCKLCPPDNGTLVQRNWHMSPQAREYQARVTAFAPGTEWNFGGIDFDGFTSGECHLKEAKSRYDQFLTGGEDGELEPKKWFKSFRLKMLPQAKKQAEVAASSSPARLTWYFQGPKTYEYMGEQVMLFPPLIAVYLP
jgi:Restriction endonuclease fold toxin 5